MNYIHIINATQHEPTADQVGVAPASQKLKDLLTVDDLPTSSDLEVLAALIADECTNLGCQYDASAVMIGGMPALMPHLERALLARNLRPLYSFTKRVSVEKDGVKTSVFKHAGWIHV